MKGLVVKAEARASAPSPTLLIPMLAKNIHARPELGELS